MAQRTAKWLAIGAVAALALGWLAGCDSAGGGSTCFSPAIGPSDPSCDAFDDNLVCPVSLTPYYSCTCTPGAMGADGGTGKLWVCAPSDTGMGAGGMGTGGTGTGGTGTGGTGTGGTGTGGSGTGGPGGTADAGDGG